MIERAREMESISEEQRKELEKSKENIQTEETFRKEMMKYSTKERETE